MNRLLADGLGKLKRRDFLKACTILTAAMGLPVEMVDKVAAAIKSPQRPPVIWLNFMECTGCTESLLRASHPDVARLILDIISLEYHETLMAAAGKQAEEALRASMKKYKGQYICVVEGAVSTKDGGIYCKIGGRTAPVGLGCAAWTPPKQAQVPTATTALAPSATSFKISKAVRPPILQ